MNDRRTTITTTNTMTQRSHTSSSHSPVGSRRHSYRSSVQSSLPRLHPSHSRSANASCMAGSRPFRANSPPHPTNTHAQRTRTNQGRRLQDSPPSSRPSSASRPPPAPIARSSVPLIESNPIRSPHPQWQHAQAKQPHASDGPFYSILQHVRILRSPPNPHVNDRNVK